MPDRLSLEVVDDVRSFGALREEWNALLSESAADTIFLTWEWLHSWWKHLSGGRMLRILTVRRGGELVGFAPFALRRGLHPLLPPRISFLGSGIVGSDYLDVVAKKGSEEEVLEALADPLARLRASIELRGVRAEGTGVARLTAALSGRGFKAFQTQSEPCPYIPLEGRSWDEYLGSLGSEHRYNFKRRLRNLQKESDFRFERISAEERRREAMAILLDLHDRRWKERGGSDAFSSREVLFFHEEVSRIALDRGWLRLFILWVGGEPAAALYGLRYRGTFSFYQSGFDPRFAPRSVGLVTMGLTIQSAIEESAEEFDFLHGDEAYKSLWARNRRELVRLELDPPGTRAFLRRGAINTERAARHAARRMLPAPVAGRIAAWLGGFSLT